MYFVLYILILIEHLLFLRYQFVALLKSMLTIDQEKRTAPDEALNHPFITLSHLVEFAHTNV
jgi:homeodomain interacting protein kinase